MGGSAILGSNLVDSLIPDVVDGLREELHPDFGVRAFRVFTIRRTWSGLTIGEGSFTDTEVELRPQPLVIASDDGITELRLEQCGLDEVGKITLKEVSLTYTEAELTGVFGNPMPAPLTDREQWLYKLSDAWGQGIESSYWVLNKRPFPDRVKDIGWVVSLRRSAD